MSKSILTLGTFDGLHRGHQQIMRRVLAQAQHLHARSVVLTFDQPPKQRHAKANAPFLLTTLPEKKAILNRLGIRATQVLRFTPRLAKIEPDVFFKKIVVGRWKTQEMIVGPRVAFGRDRRGRLPMLRELGKHHGVKISMVRPVQDGRKALASSLIREALRKGDVEKAARFLGYMYSAGGRVMHGDRRGRSLGYPTANLQVPKEKILPPGVFWVKVMVGRNASPIPSRDQLASAIEGLCNVGFRPTFKPVNKTRTCEVFLFKNPGSLYGKSLRVFFLKRLRGERHFKRPSDLVRQINLDFKYAKTLNKNNFLRKFSLPF